MKVIKSGLLEQVSFNETDMSDSLNIEVRNVGGEECQYETFVFNGGEQHIRFKEEVAGSVIITARLRNANDIMGLLLINDALRRMISLQSIFCEIEYLPYARQDRVCNEGEPLSIKVMCDLVNICKFDAVFITDPHSDVAPALLNNCVVEEQYEWVKRLNDKLECFDGKTIISPDAGAAKKAYKVAKALGDLDVVMAGKVRDTKSGEITGTDVYGGVKDKECLIVDDICDGGRTFIELAKQLKFLGAKSVELAVTHGIFSKGLDVLKENIDHVYTTKSFNMFTPSDFLTVAE